jgi:hypothetical protein
MPNKELIRTLKGAKTFLRLSEKRKLEAERKSRCICFAITDYISSIYGKAQVRTEGTKPNRLEEEAQTYIMHELCKLTETVFFNYEAAAKVLGIEPGREENLDLQEARHLWLDRLIAELEQA